MKKEQLRCEENVQQYLILDYRGRAVGSVWATSVTPRTDPTMGFWFYWGSQIIASCWFGYKGLGLLDRPIVTQSGAERSA